MEYNAVQQDNNSPPISLPNRVNNETRNGLPKTCDNCKRNQLNCDSAVPCSSCISLGKSDICTGMTTSVAAINKNSTVQPETTKSSTTPAKRGYKSHVPSACINCKTAHLACDVSRPCQRCVTLMKTDTCQDMQHKKRGRPKLREKKIYSSNEHTYEILYGTIQTPAITMKNPTRNIVPNNQVPPFKTKLATISKRPSAISFIHEPIESFQSNNESSNTTNNSLTETSYQQNTTAITTSVPLAFDYSNSNINASLLLETVLPTIQLSSNPQLPLMTSQQQQQQQQLYFDCSSISTSDNSNTNTSILLNSSNSINNITSTKLNNNQQQHSNTDNENEGNQHLTIIMSMEVCCAKVSDDTIKCWGYYPQELAHRSFYDFISPKDSDRLARLHRLLIDNVMDIAKKNSNNNASIVGDNSPLPPTERTTSSLFSNTDQSKLNVIANGSRSFSDSIRIKKRSGEYELYKVVVYIGGGLGADLYDITSFSKQYIVAQFRKHEYEVVPQPAQQQLTAPVSATLPTDDDSKSSSNNNESSLYNMQPIAVFSPMSPLSPSSPSNSSMLNFSNSSISSNSSSGINTSTYVSVDTFKDSHSLFHNSRNNEKRLSTTTKFSQMSIIPPSSPPKFNIAPITTAHTTTTSTIASQHSKSFSNSLFRRFPPSASSSASATASAVITPPASVCLRSTDNAVVTHPTQQYFLQTTSSTLNAAASAAHSKTRLSISGPTNNDNTSTTNRKMEMSIRSLLC